MSRGSYLARTAGGTRKAPTQSGGDRSGFRTLDRPTKEVAQQRQQLQRRQRPRHHRHRRVHRITKLKIYKKKIKINAFIRRDRRVQLYSW